MNKLFCVLILMVISTCSAAKEVRLALQHKDGLVIVSIENLSYKSVKVSRLFTQNPAFGLIELDIMSNGHHLGLTSPPDESFPSESDYVTLKPFEVIGQAFSVPVIRRWYAVTEKCFSISATYHDVFAKKFMAFSATVKSKQVTICR